MRRGPDEAWRALALRQEGLLSRRQLSELGVDRWAVRSQVRAERWTLRTPMVVSTTTGPLSRAQVRWLGVLHAGPEALVGDLSAAEVHGLERWHRDDVTIVVPQGLELDEDVEGVVFRRTRRALGPMSASSHLPVMRLEPAVLHFADYQHSRRTAQGVLAAVVQQQLTTPERLHEWVRRMRPLRWAGLLRTALDEIEGGARSVSELDVARLCREHGLTPPHRQVRRRGSDGRLRYTDCEWDLPGGGVLVLEIDGAFHMHAENWEDDIARERSLVSTDRIVVRCTARELREEAYRVAHDLLRLGVLRTGTGSCP
ncbi:hypothetical protein I601_1967 [Nocardioides dokdonensis FR1436]|uniref:DUF559 domain-containing protein n=1 Tax=Nocardioides dokdonensis FR1436 TaxID=1300347 RepID=A0A1A9GJZ1_9ACTN|nr:hypothetical protein [Nocardioides dokdonensis]ANH38396.1 hypothetical protein I601_1967 [Nocardioides dokdonensis FR1436]